MKQPVLWDKEYGLAELHNKPVVSSRFIASYFEKNHSHVLRDIERLLDGSSGLSAEFGESNFGRSSYRSVQNKKMPKYFLTRNGFMMLVMGYTGTRAMRFKEAYIRRFDEMEQFIQSRILARREFPELTDAILLAHDKPMPYHFSNEMDMINRIVLGMTAKEYRQNNGLGTVDSIRPFLDHEEIRCIALLQKADIGLVIAIPDYQDRKAALERHYRRITQKRLTA